MRPCRTRGPSDYRLTEVLNADANYVLGTHWLLRREGRHRQALGLVYGVLPKVAWPLVLSTVIGVVKEIGVVTDIGVAKEVSVVADGDAVLSYVRRRLSGGGLCASAGSVRRVGSPSWAAVGPSLAFCPALASC